MPSAKLQKVFSKESRSVVLQSNHSIPQEQHRPPPLPKPSRTFRLVYYTEITKRKKKITSWLKKRYDACKIWSWNKIMTLISMSCVKTHFQFGVNLTMYCSYIYGNSLYSYVVRFNLMVYKSNTYFK
jgi:hypothetical protein